jgi:hypothetical protein
MELLSKPPIHLHGMVLNKVPGTFVALHCLNLLQISFSMVLEVNIGFAIVENSSQLIHFTCLVFLYEVTVVILVVVVIGFLPNSLHART